MKWSCLPLLALLLLVPALSVPAADEGNLRLQSIAEIEVERLDAEGKKVVERVVAEKVLPQTEVIYTNRFTNTGKEPAGNLVLTNPVPVNMTYVEGSAQGMEARVTFSVDGGNKFDTPGALMVLGEDGKLRTARADEYSHIRWQINHELPPGETGEVSFRARLK